jgi:predicted transcriptional regulator
MDTLILEIKSRKDMDAAFITAFEAARSGKPYKPTRGVYFADLESVRQFLTEKRMELLRVIRDRKPRSINELASMTGRDFKNVYMDVKLLIWSGILKKSKKDGTLRPVLEFPYKAIEIRASI